MLIETILNNLFDIIIFIIFLGILVAVHEWGHFITAKKMGVEVTEFSLGFGPTLFSKWFNGTNYLIKLLPLGGYVKMAGEDRLKCSGKDNEFFSKSPGVRALIIFNGPLINFILALVCFYIVFVVGHPDLSSRIGSVLQGKPAALQGILAGDEIQSVNGKNVYGWTELKDAIAKAQSPMIDLMLERNGEVINIQVEAQAETRPNMFGLPEEALTIGISPYGNVIGYIDEKAAGYKAGLREGDQIMSVSGVDVNGWIEIQEQIQSVTAKEFDMLVQRDNQMFSVNIMPEFKTMKVDGEKKEMPLVGISPQQDIEYYRFGLLESASRAIHKFAHITSLTIQGLSHMLTGTMSAKENIAGPVAIFGIVNEFADKGLVDFLLILGIISLNLAIFNLLPVIPLDGGHLFLLLIEKIRGRALPEKVDEMIAKVGLSLILLLALFVFYVDFERIGLFEKLRNLF